MFQFKQFKVYQEAAAMKVGTDAVLLGAWTKVSKATNILDIGTGTGLIALMLAQRSSNSKIKAIEIDKAAFSDCCLNFRQSKWKDRLQAVHIDLMDFVPEHLFDCIVSNPPFYNNSFANPDPQRALARQTASLSFDNLLSKTASLLAANGNASFIIPFTAYNDFIMLAKKYQLFLNRVMYIKGTENSAIKRMLLELKFEQNIVAKDELIIEIDRHVYTEKYKKLTQDFYLKF